jgi:O-antigen/teichoic acid export membrane protein
MVCQGNYIRRAISEALSAGIDLLLIIIIVIKIRTINSLVLSVSLSIIVFYVLYSIIFKFNIFKGKFDKEKLKVLLQLGLPLFIGSIATMAMESANGYIINFFYGLAEVGLYNISRRMPSMIELIYNSLCLILLSRLSVLFDSGNLDRVNYWMNLLMRMFLFLALIVSIVFVSSGQVLIRVLTNKNYIFDVLPIVLCLFTARSILYGALLIYGRLFELTKATKWLGFCWLIVMLFSLAFNTLFIYKWGILGSAIGDLLALTIGFLIVRIKKIAFIIWNIPLKRYFFLYLLLVFVSCLSAIYIENMIKNIITTIGLVIIAFFFSFFFKLVKFAYLKNN